MYSGTNGDMTFACTYTSANFIWKNGTTPTERMRIDSSGRLLIGTSSTISVNTQNCPVQVEGTTAETSRISLINRGNNASGAGIHIAKSRGTAPALVQDNDQVGGIFFCAGDANDFNSLSAKIECFIDGAPSGNDTPGRITFSTTPDQTDSPVERMRIDNNGSVIVGTGGGDVPNGTARGGSGFINETDNRKTLYLATTTSAAGLARFYNSNGQVGTITVSGSATAFNTSSDYRLKENVVDIADGITRVKQLSPKRFNFIVDADTTVDGFLAHEAQTIVPEAVTGTHNEVDDDGNAVMQGIDQSKLVPLLTAALQEAIAKIETLEQRLSDAGIA